MPNWNNNHITLTATSDTAKGQLHEFIDRHIVVLGKRNWSDSLLELDSDSIIPMPEGIKKLMAMGPLVDTADGYKDNPDYDEEAERKQREQNLKDYGYADWYEFRLDKWGSKWGFCHTAFYGHTGSPIDTKEELHASLDLDGEIDFTTDCAWGPAVGLMKRICELYPEIIFKCEWGEEQVTEYYGMFTYDKGNGWQEISKSEMDVDVAYNMLDSLGLLIADEDDGYFPNHRTGLVDYDERLNADSDEYIPEDERDGIEFGTRAR